MKLLSRSANQVIEGEGYGEGSKEGNNIGRNASRQDCCFYQAHRSQKRNDQALGGGYFVVRLVKRETWLGTDERSATDEVMSASRSDANS